MSNHKVIAIISDSISFDTLHTYLSVHDIEYQNYETFELYLTEHDFGNHVLLVCAHDVNNKFMSVENGNHSYNRQLYNSTYIIAYEHGNCTESLKSALLNGADDFLSFPFHPELMGLKIIAQQKRMDFIESMYLNEQNTLIYKNLTIDPFSKQIFLRNQRLDLTHSEFNILYTLAKNPNDVFNMEYLFQMITGQKSLGDYNALMTHVSRLRKKLAQVDAAHHYILTVRNKGYKFNAHHSEYAR